MATGLETFPPGWLEGTPFKSYRIPGLLLAGLVGGSASNATLAVVRGSRRGGAASMVAGALTAGWIAGEVLLLNQPAPTPVEAVYFGAGVAMLALGARSRRLGS